MIINKFGSEEKSELILKIIKNCLKCTVGEDLREDNDLLQKDVARIFHLTQTNYSKYELEKINIPIDLLKKFAIFYNTSTDYILGLTNDKKAYKRTKVES